MTADLKLYVINALSLIVSMTNIEPVLKVLLLVVTIGYTVSKWHESWLRKNGKKNDK